MRWFVFISLIFLWGCDDHSNLNNPHQAHDKHKMIFYSAFSERPKTLDPAKSYNSNEATFTAQIYEPPLQYNYLLRPYQLEPLTAQAIPKISYQDKDHKNIGENPESKKIAYTIYDIAIKPGIFYQPHPAFAKDGQGRWRYHQLTTHDTAKIYTLKDFKYVGTRELIAQDYAYQIKRLANPQLTSPILGFMSQYIVGLGDLNQQLAKKYQQQFLNDENHFIDLRQVPLAGVNVIDKYHYQIILNGQYPQFKYWLAMPFFAPMPWEVDYFYSQPGLMEKNISLDWYPVGTGPYQLTENNPNQRMVLVKNPNYHPDYYPNKGELGDKSLGLLVDANQRLPFIDEIIFSLEKERIPLWSKFFQGYYDSSSISSDNFDEAIRVDENGKPELTAKMQSRKIRLQRSIEPGVYYMGFNMMDDVVGGDSQRARLLRQAIAIAVDYDEFIDIFLNGRGIAAQGPIPPGIFGYHLGSSSINPYVYTWGKNRPVRKNIEDAKKLLAQAGYPNGIDKNTGQPLVLNYDVTVGSGPDEKSQFDWYRKQFAKLGIDLQIRATQYNRFQEKMRTGNAQIFSWGWLADYPDPENFLFLFYGPNSKVKFGGENAANYSNNNYDHLFEQMRHLPDNQQRQKIIDQMVEQLRYDSPIIWGFHPEVFTLVHQWSRIGKPNDMARNTLKYARLDPELRKELQLQWNKPVYWPLGILLLAIIVIIIPVIIRYRQHQQRKRK